MPEEVSETPQPTESKSFDWPKIVVAAVLGLGLLAGAAYAGYWYGTERAKFKSQSVEPQPKTQTQETPVPKPTSTPTPIVEDETGDWKTYKNVKYGYELKYSEGAAISLAREEDFSYETDEKGEPKLEELKNIQPEQRFNYLFNKFGGEICVTINYKLGYINVSAKENNDARYVICSPTGVGVHAEAIKEEANIGGKIYQVGGMYQDDPSEKNLFGDSEFLVVDLENGIRVTYGSKSDRNATYEDYLKDKEVLKKILSTFKFLD